jgi:polysaccharide pyruvyl transferase WcaK-like protein
MVQHLKTRPVLLRSQFDHRLRWLRQKLAGPTVGIVGGYHGGNLGDMALGAACEGPLRKAGYSTGLQTIYSLPSWPACEFAVLGGGAIGYREPLQNVYARYGKSPERVFFLGVDFNDESAVLEFADFLRNAGMITCRSRAQAEQMQRLLGRPDVRYHPDLVFALRTSFNQLPKTREDNQRVLGVNCATFFWLESGRDYVPGSAWETEVRQRSPHLAPWISTLGPSYVKAFRTVLKRARQEGWQIWHVPFTPADDRFARHFLSSQVDRFIRYTPDPFHVLQTFRSFSRFLPTRFHSLVFALLSSTAVIPFCYAEKSEQLFFTLGVPLASQITAREIAIDSPLLTQAWESPVRIDDEVLDRAERDVSAVLEATCDAIRAFV